MEHLPSAFRGKNGEPLVDLDLPTVLAYAYSRLWGDPKAHWLSQQPVPEQPEAGPDPELGSRQIGLPPSRVPYPAASARVDSLGNLMEMISRWFEALKKLIMGLPFFRPKGGQSAEPPGQPEVREPPGEEEAGGVLEEAQERVGAPVMGEGGEQGEPAGEAAGQVTAFVATPPPGRVKSIGRVYWTGRVTNVHGAPMLVDESGSVAGQQLRSLLFQGSIDELLDISA